MPTCLIVVCGPPLPGRWAFAHTLAQRLGGRTLCSDVVGSWLSSELERHPCLVVHGELATAGERQSMLALGPADERVLVEWICSEAEARREIFHRWVSRPRTLAERELERYLAWEVRATPVADNEAEVVVHVGGRAPLSDQLLRVLEALQPRPTLPPASPESRRPTVLLVEDDPDQRQLMGEVLFELGCDVDLAPDGETALALLEERDDSIDLVISDQRMPGMTGVELAEILAVRHPRLRLVLLTAHADREVVERALGAHARNVLRKPVSVMDLRRLVDDVA